MNFRTINKFFLLLTLLFLPLILSASTLHVMMIGDSNGFDDINGKNGIAIDLDNVSQLFKEIAYSGGLDHTETIITDDEVVGSRIYEELNQLNVEEDDIVVFYFTGHGYRTNTTENIWANLYLSNNLAGVELSEVIQLIEEKKPRLMLVLSDTCNNVIPDFKAPLLMSKETFAFGQNPNFINNIRTLFLNFDGKIVAISAEPGLYSILTSQGSLFTTSFVQHLKHDLNLDTRLVSWDGILTKVVSEISDIDLGDNEKQIPYFEISPI